MRRRAATVAVLVALAGLTTGPAQAQAQAGDVKIDRVSIDDYPTVELTVTVPESFGDTRLFKESFTVSENGATRPRPTLGNRPDEPEAARPRAVLAVDVSGSMNQAIARARDAADAFVRSLPTGSEVAIVTFGNDVDVLLPFTSDVGRVRSAVQGIDVTDVQAETALYDGVIRAADLLPANDDRPSSIILLSDGTDTVCPSADKEAINHLRERDTTLWAVSLEGSEPDPAALRALAGETGRFLTAESADALDAIYRGLASDLSRRYVLRYESEASGRTAINVTVDHLASRARGTTTVDIDAAAAVTPDRPPPVAAPDVFTVTLPPLATTTAYLVGVTAVALGSMVIWLILLAPRPPRTRERLLPDLGGGHQRPRLSAIAEWTTEFADRSVRDRTLGRRIDRYLEGAGLDLRPGEVVVIVASTMVVAYAAGVLSGGPLLGVLLAGLPPLIVRLLLAVRSDRRQAAFSDQLTDILQLISGSLRAGHGLLQGIDAVARDADEPAASEFRRILIEHRLGRDLSTAMHSCAERMDNADFAWVVQAIGIHREVGGDLSRVLDNVIATVRDRGDVHRQVRTLSAEARLSAWVLTGLPFLVLIAIRALNPEYMNELFTQPIGWVMLATAAVLMLIGTLWMRRLMRVRY